MDSEGFRGQHQYLNVWFMRDAPIIYNWLTVPDTNIATNFYEAMLLKKLDLIIEVSY